jgi:gas vesicle protein
MIMKEELIEKGNTVLMPFLVGGIVGAGIALLLAPKPGKEVREDIKRFASNAKERVSSAVDQGKVLYEEGRTAVAGAIDAGKTAYIQEKEKFRHVS